MWKQKSCVTAADIQDLLIQYSCTDKDLQLNSWIFTSGKYSHSLF